MTVNSTYGPNGQVEKGQWHGLSAEERTKYVEQYAPLINYIADRLSSRLPAHVNKEDLISSGVLGLIDAIDKFDPERGIMFKTYAEFRVKGAMLDDLRNMDWVPRTVRRKTNELERLWRRLEGELGRPPSDEESAEAMGLSIGEYLHQLDEVYMVNMLDLEAFKLDTPGHAKEHADIYNILADESSPDALTVLGQEEVRKVLIKGIDTLPDREKMVVTLYYHEEMTMKEIGQIMGFTESRISQLHTKSVIRLRGFINRYFESVGQS
ncbi:MAG: FliA/WhiG family RNA polymerase sigma factor [Deltaproteobacteria bacterium]|jgi:RNA polymerase sigma factor for flagellar operon FliA|nr:FliA/WhiG family RNA polymerase sigma factor [Deltaproteobacteria bacterium]